MIITLLRKPIDGSVANNALKHGCGAINIDDTRIGTGHHLPLGKVTSKRLCLGAGSGIEGKRENFTPRVADGRFPANFILNHKEGCELKGTKKVKGHKNSNGMTNQGFGANGVYGKANPTKCFDYTDEDGNEEIADWACVEGCPVKELDQQSGYQKSGVAGVNSRAWGVAGKGQLSSTEDGVGWKAYGSEGYQDEGGASRFFKLLNTTTDLINYFKIMISPPIDDACIIVSTPQNIDFSAYKKDSSAASASTYQPMIHGLILLGEPTEEQSKEIIDLLKPGAHVVLIPKDVGYKGVITLEDSGLEVRDAIFVAEASDSFYYTSKAGKKEKEAGLDGLPLKKAGAMSGAETRADRPTNHPMRANIHPTVKPINLMRYLIRLITPPRGTVLDPFMGSGSTGCAAALEGVKFIGIEREEEYFEIAKQRIKYWQNPSKASKKPIKDETHKEAEQPSLFSS